MAWKYYIDVVVCVKQRDERGTLTGFTFEKTFTSEPSDNNVSVEARAALIVDAMYEFHLSERKEIE